MTDKEKLDKVKKLADAMYTAAQYLSTDASVLRKAMDEYHQFIITEYNQQEPASEDLEEAANQIVNKAIPTLAQKYKDGTYVGRIRDCFDRKEFIDLVKAGAKWQREQMMKDAIDSEVKWCNHGYPDIHLEDLAVLDEIQLPKDKFAIGDKVKVIIVKDND